MGLFVGIMSGTSLDGADAALVTFSDAGKPTTLAFVSAPFPTLLRERLVSLNRPGGTSELSQAAEASLALAQIYAKVTLDVLRQAGVAADRVTAVGCHGQTIRHRPELGYTVQLNNPAYIAEATRIRVVADFRSRDLAAGGQGAPLAPAFHSEIFRDPAISRAIVNVGGIANLSLVAPDKPVTGFDCGPGNVLMDVWYQRQSSAAFDRDGAFARSGHVHPSLLATLRSEPYFALSPPKSTGRDLFDAAWLDSVLSDHPSIRPADVQATLLELTASTIADAVRTAQPATDEVFVCGGGAYNGALMERLGGLLAPLPIASTATLGVPPQHVEAVMVAWLARACVDNRALDLTEVTGARHPLVYGAIYPA